MEVALAAAAAGAWSAYMASVKEGRSQPPGDLLREGVRLVKSLVEPPAPDPAEGLRGLPLVVGANHESLECDRAGLPDAPALYAVIAFLHAVGGAGRLQHLHLSHTALGGAAEAEALAAALRGLAGLRTLRLRGCALGERQASTVCAALLSTALSPDAAAAAAAAATAAAAAPPHGATPAHADIGAAADAEGSSSLMVSSACRDRAPPALTLEELDLTSNGIGGGEGAAAVALLLASAPALRRLDLGYNGLGGRGCVALADAVAALPALQSVGLAANDIDDEAVCGLALALRRRGSPVRELDLEANLAADTAMQELLRFSAASASLLTLRTGANAVGPVGGAAVAAHLLAHPNGPLTSLTLSNNPLGQAAGAALAAAMSENQACMHMHVQSTPTPALLASQLGSPLRC